MVTTTTLIDLAVLSDSELEEMALAVMANGWEKTHLNKLIESEQEKRKTSVLTDSQKLASEIIKLVDDAGYRVSDREGLREDIAGLLRDSGAIFDT